MRCENQNDLYNHSIASGNGHGMAPRFLDWQVTDHARSVANVFRFRKRGNFEISMSSVGNLVIRKHSCSHGTGHSIGCF